MAPCGPAPLGTAFSPLLPPRAYPNKITITNFLFPQPAIKPSTLLIMMNSRFVPAKCSGDMIGLGGERADVDLEKQLEHKSEILA